MDADIRGVKLHTFLNLLAAVAHYPSAFARTTRIGTGRPFLLMHMNLDMLSVMVCAGVPSCLPLPWVPTPLYRPPCACAALWLTPRTTH